jgi:hypothetical protein
MSEEQKVNQPQNDAQEVVAKETKTDEVKEQTFTQQQLDNIIKQRLESEKAKHQRILDEQKRCFKRKTSTRSQNKGRFRKINARKIGRKR